MFLRFIHAVACVSVSFSSASQSKWKVRPHSTFEQGFAVRQVDASTCEGIQRGKREKGGERKEGGGGRKEERKGGKEKGRVGVRPHLNKGESK